MSVRPSVLVVEDDQAVRESLRRSLEFNGYAVSLAADGNEALAAVRSHQPDAVVMDVMMPRMDGLEATRLLRESGNRVPVLVIFDARQPRGGLPYRILQQHHPRLPHACCRPFASPDHVSCLPRLREPTRCPTLQSRPCLRLRSQEPHPLPPRFRP